MNTPTNDRREVLASVYARAVQQANKRATPNGPFVESITIHELADIIAVQGGEPDAPPPVGDSRIGAPIPRPPGGLRVLGCTGNDMCTATEQHVSFCPLNPESAAQEGERGGAEVAAARVGTLGDDERCGRCGGENVIWCAQSPLWNYVMRGNDIAAEDDPAGIVCMRCFVVLADARGVRRQWRVTTASLPDDLIYTTPSGRTWDSDRWLWIEPERADRIEAQP